MCSVLRKTLRSLTGELSELSSLGGQADLACCSNRDINGYTKANSVMEPLAIYKGHTAIVEVSRKRGSAFVHGGGLTRHPLHRTSRGTACRTTSSPPSEMIASCSCTLISPCARSIWLADLALSPLRLPSPILTLPIFHLPPLTSLPFHYCSYRHHPGGTLAATLLARPSPPPASRPTRPRSTPSLSLLTTRTS